MVNKLCYRAMLLTFIQFVITAHVFAMEPEITVTLPSRPLEQIVTSFSAETIPVTRAGVSGTVTIESADEQTATIKRSAAELSSLLKFMIEELGPEQKIPINLSGALFAKFIDSLKSLDAITTIDPQEYVQSLVKVLASILSGLSYGDMLALFAETNRLHIEPLIWYIATLFATKLWQSENLDQVSIITKQLAPFINLPDFVVNVLNKSVYKNLLKQLLVDAKPSLTFNLPEGSFWLSSIRALPNKDLLALTGSNLELEKIYLWNFTRDHAHPAKTLESHAQVMVGALDVDGKKALVRNNDKTIDLWDLEKVKVIKTLQEERSHVTTLVFIPGSQKALSGSGDGSVYVWDLTNGQIISELVGHIDTIISLAVSSDGKYAFTGSLDRSAILWDLTKEGKKIMPYKTITTNREMTSVALSSDDKYGLTTTYDNVVRFWDLEAVRVIREFGPFEADYFVSSLAMSRDGQYALAGSNNATTRLLNLQTGEVIKEFKSQDISLYSTQFDLEERRIANQLIGSAIINIWDLPKFDKLPQLILFRKINQLGKEKVLANPYFKQVYDSLSKDLTKVNGGQ